jgi:hypothetical protein
MHRKTSYEALFTPTHGFSVLIQQENTTCAGGEKNMVRKVYKVLKVEDLVESLQ